MMNQRRILIVDPEAESRARIAQSFDEREIEAIEAETGLEGLELARQEKPDVVLLAGVLPDVTGLGLCRLIRSEPALAATAIIMVSHYAHEVDRILAFEMEVHDFLAQPFFPRELEARVRAVLKRSPCRSTTGVRIQRNARAGLQIDSDGRTVRADGRLIDLTRREFELLLRLVERGGRVLTRRELIDDVWGGGVHNDRVIDTHIKSIRRKLGELGKRIETVRGVGYRFDDGHPA